jgi:hypothetical protein
MMTRGQPTGVMPLMPEARGTDPEPMHNIHMLHW